jgi:hypothetical protein
MESAGSGSDLASRTEESQNSEERKPLQFGVRIVHAVDLASLWRALNKRFKGFTQHCCVFLAVVSEPPFPQGVGANAVIRDVGFGVCDDVFDVLPRSQLTHFQRVAVRQLS